MNQAKQPTGTPTTAAVADVKNFLEGHKNQLALALPRHVSVDRLMRVVINSLSRTPKLQECTFSSFIGAVLQSASLGLEPNTPLQEAAIIPYWNGQKRVVEAQFQPMWRGLINLSRRSGQLTLIYADAVRERDEFDWSRGLEPKLVHRPLVKGDRGEVIGIYAVFHLATGEKDFEFMTVDQINAIRERSKNRDREGKVVGPWVTDWEEMARKTAIKRLLKRAPISIELAKAIDLDNQATMDAEVVSSGYARDVFEDLGVERPSDGDAPALANPEGPEGVPLEMPQRKSEKVKSGAVAPPTPAAQQEPVI